MRQVWRYWGKRVLILLLVLTPLELGCARLAYHTLSEVDSIGLFLILIAGNLLTLLTLAVRLPRMSIVLMILISLLIIPNQIRLGIRLLMLNNEASRIVEYVESEVARTGKCPSNLSKYKFAFSSNEKHIQSYRVAPGGYIFYWYIGNRNASHWYAPLQGYRYYPD